MDQFEYNHVLNSQSKSEADLNSFKDDNKTREVREKQTKKLQVLILLSPSSSSSLSFSSSSSNFLPLSSLSPLPQIFSLSPSPPSQITFAKQKGDILGLVVIDSGYGSVIPSCIVAHMNKTGAAGRSNLLNVGDQILSINGVSLVGMPLRVAIEQIKVSMSQ